MALERGTVVDGKYEILKEIGRGGMSVVYLAMDNRLNKQWAVKVLQRQGIGKNNEVIINKVPDDTELMKRLDHPAIPRIVDIIDREDDPQIYIVMDYVEGESLDKILDEFGAQPQELVIDWAKQICDTLGYLHSQKPPIIYRDMKPANIMLKPEGNIKLIDFGIAREYKEQSLADTTALGTRGYASPEHFGGRTDARSDIYTLGMTMHHLLTGADPRPKSYEYIPIREYNPELSSGLEHIIDKCTAWDPDDRYQNCNELMYDLEHYTEIDDNYKKKQKNKLLTFIISAGLSVLFVVLGVIMGIVNQNANKDNYNYLVNIESLSYEEADERIENATNIKPEELTAYRRFLNKISNEDGIISGDELNGFASHFSKLVREHKSGNISDNDFGNFAFDVGEKVFLYYDAKDFATRAIKAKSYFENIYEYDRANMKYKQVINCSNADKAKLYYIVSVFYSSTKADKKDYANTYNAMLDMMNYATKDDSKTIIIYKSFLDFVNSYYEYIVYDDGITEDGIVSTLEKIKNDYTKHKYSTDYETAYKSAIKEYFEPSQGSGRDIITKVKQAYRAKG